MSYWRFPKYVSVRERRQKAERNLKQLLKRNPGMKPVKIKGRSLARTWWGKAWNQNLEAYADFANRIGRGRSYVRHSAVLDLKIEPGRVLALVQGSASRPYNVTIEIKKLSPRNWRNIKAACEGEFDSLKQLLSGKFPSALGNIFTRQGKGLFPTPKEIEFSCSCPDWASMCKHVAAALYGVGARLDEDPGLFFRLRRVKMDDLVSEAVAESSRGILQRAAQKTTRVMDAGDLADVFGIDMDDADPHDAPSPPASPGTRSGKSKPKAPKQATGKTPKAERAAQLQAVEEIIRRHPKGTTTAVIVDQSGLATARVRYLVAQLKKQKKIKAARRGLYVTTRSKSTPSRSAQREQILEIVKKSPRGVTTATLVEKSGLDVAAIRYAIAYLKSRKKIKTPRRGLYVPVDKVMKTLKRRRTRKAPIKKSRRAGMTAVIYELVAQSPEGISVADLVKQTGLYATNVRHILYRLKARGAIESVSRGVYQTAR